MAKDIMLFLLIWVTILVLISTMAFGSNSKLKGTDFPIENVKSSESYDNLLTFYHSCITQRTPDSSFTITWNKNTNGRYVYETISFDCDSIIEAYKVYSE